MRRVAIVGAGMTAFGEHFALGLKDLLPMAYCKCAASVDKGLAKWDLHGAWSVPRVPLTGSRPGYWPTAWDCRTSLLHGPRSPL